MKLHSIVLVLIWACSSNLYAQVPETRIQPTRANGTADYSKPGLVIKGDKIMQLRKDGTIDHSKQQYKIVNGEALPLRANGTVDHSKPKLKLGKK